MSMSASLAQWRNVTNKIFVIITIVSFISLQTQTIEITNCIFGIVGTL